MSFFKTYFLHFICNIFAFCAQHYNVVKMFLNEFLGYEIQYVFNVTGNYFLDLNKTFQENQIAYGDILIYGR